MLSCNELSLNYAIVLYGKAHTKIEIVQNIIQELPSPPHTAYFLCDSWYASNKLMDAFAQRGFQTIGAMRTNRIIYPNQVKQQAKQFAPSICKNDPNVSLVTVGKRSYYVYRYQGKMNGYKDAVVLLAIPKNPLEKPRYFGYLYRLIQGLPHRKFSTSVPSAGISKYSSEAVSRNTPSTSSSFARNKALRGCG